MAQTFHVLKEIILTAIEVQGKNPSTVNHSVTYSSRTVTVG